MNAEKLADTAIASARTIAKRLRAAKALTVAEYMAEADEKQAIEMEHLLSIIAIYEATKQKEGNVVQ